ncbi:MAG: glycosyltransferase family 9 protein [Candidatus Gastranaerophilales bacterium]|nr:glycosyltransferase family 9 protein [Candidatus Gastranaerophilales bacterium]
MFDKKEIEKKILVINEGKLGDVIVTSPLCKELKLKYPEHKLYFIAGPYGAEVAKFIPEVDDVIIFDKKNAHKGLNGLFSFLKENKKLKNADYAFVVHRYNRGNLLALLLGAKRRISDWKDSKFYKYFLTDKMYKDIYSKPIKKTKEYGNYINFDTGLVENRDFELSFDVSDEVLAHSEKILRYYTNEPFENMVVISLNYCWSVDKTSELLQKLNILHKTPVVIGAPYSSFMEGEIKADFVDLAGQTSIDELCGIIRACGSIITVDTGTLHIAAAYGKPIVALMPDDHFEMWGYEEKSKIITYSNYSENYDAIEVNDVIERFLSL